MRPVAGAVGMWETRVLCGFSKRGGKVRSLDFSTARHFHRPLTRDANSFGHTSPLTPKRSFLSCFFELQLTHLSGQLDQDVDSQPGAS